MPEYHTINIREDYLEWLEEQLEEMPEFIKPKDLMKQATNEYVRERKAEELRIYEKLINHLLEKTELTREELLEIVEKEEHD